MDKATLMFDIAIEVLNDDNYEDWHKPLTLSTLHELFLEIAKKFEEEKDR